MKLNFFKKIKNLKVKSGKNYLVISVIICLVVLIALFFGTMAWGVYKLGWRGGFADNFLEIMPWPAAKVNQVNILYPDYLKDLKAAEKFYAKQKESGYTNIPTSEQLQKIILEDRLITNVLVKEIANRYKITVSQKDIDEATNTVIANAGGQDKMTKFLKDYYGLDLLDYKKYFVEPNLYYDKTNEAVIDDESLNGAAKKKIQEALSKLRNGENFEDVAKAYSENEKADQHASQENFLRGELPKDLEDQLFALADGKYTDVVTLPDSYAIFKLLKKDDDKGVLTTQRIIVKLKTLADLITEQKQKAQIKIYAY